MQPSDFLLTLSELTSVCFSTRQHVRQSAGAALIRQGGLTIAVVISLDLSFEFCIL